MSQKPKQMARRASLIYGALAGTWILLSDWLVGWINFTRREIWLVETAKGLLFVGFTCWLFYILMRRTMAREEASIVQLRQAEALANLQRETLERITRSRPLAETLDRLLRGLEAQSPEMLCSILLLDPDGEHLRHLAAPSLPEAYNRAIDGAAIGPKAGSCGTAAFRGSPVFASDISRDPLWTDYRHLALPHGLRSCWSTPILDEQKKVLGTFAIYHRHAGLPTAADVGMIELVTHTAATAIIKQRAETALRESEERFRTLVDQASDSIFVHDLQGRLLDVNRSACASLGYAREELLKLPVTAIEEGFRLEELQKLWHGLPPGQSAMLRGRHRRKDGTTFPVEVSMASYEIQGRRVLAALARNITERADYEAQLARSISLLRTTIESSASGLLVVGTDNRVTAHNHRFLEMWRLPPGTAAEGKDDGQLLQQVLEKVAEPEKFLARVRELYAHPEMDSFDTILLKDGRVLDRVSRPQRLGDQIIGRVWSFQDITERTRAEESMRLQSVALESADNAIVITDRDGTIQWVNPAFSRSSGYSLAESLGKNPRDLLHSGQQPREYFHGLWQTILAGKVWHGELTNRRKDGTLFPEEMTITPLKDGGNRVTHFVAIKQDITERKRMEAQLRQAGERTQFYMNRMPLAFIAWNRDFRVAEWNPAAEKIFGWTAAQAVGRHAYELIVPPDIQPAVTKVWEDVFASGNLSSHSINDNIAKDGRRIICEWRNAPWRDANGQICGCLSIVEDITERIQSEKKRDDLENQLRQSQKLEAIGQLSGGIAHDFNNILTVIQGNAAMLQNLDLAPGESRECSNQIARAAERAAGLTRQLLMFARKQQMQPVSLDLNETVAQVTKMLQRILGEDITLHTEFAPALPPVHADIGMVEQIILNLAVNARDAMDEGGRLAIRTGAEAGQVFLQVEDNGSGIAPEVLPRIFDPFFTTKEVGKGTGLGLATVYGIVQQHHGKIDVQSEPGKGTTFTIAFPASSQAGSAPAAPAAKPALPCGHETVLLVEDEAPLRAFVSELLQRCGYTVLEAGSGPAALKAWAEHRQEITLVLTDVIMPEGLNGLSLGRRLQAEKPALKVIYTSGYTGNLEGRQGTQLVEGVNFIRKPFKPDALATLIRNSLDGKTARA